MHKVYLLLRNNKNQGPYTLEELVQQSLKPFDLVWIEGKSVGWKYPTEIEMLKPYVIEAAQPAEVKKEIPVVQEIARQNTVEPTLPSRKTQVEEKKPFKSKTVYVSLPGGLVPSSPAPALTLSPPVTEEESFSKKLEQKAEELYQRAQAYAEKKEKEKTQPKVVCNSNTTATAGKEVEIDTKYTRSLDDIKDEYSTWLYEQKRNKKGTKRKTNLTIAATVLILAIGFMTAKIVFKKNDASLVAEHNIPAPDLNKTSITKRDLTANKSNKKTAKENAKPITQHTPVVAKQKSKPVTTPAIKNTEKKLPVKNENTVATAPKTNPVFLPDQVKISGQYAANKKGIPDFNITVNNNNNEQLKFVAVDVYYYYNDGSLAGKKTLYFNKVPAHGSMTQKAPGNSKADDVIFRMGLMSSERGELYYTKL